MCIEILESSENILQTSNTVSERDLQKKIFRNEIETIYKQILQKKKCEEKIHYDMTWL